MQRGNGCRIDQANLPLQAAIVRVDCGAFPQRLADAILPGRAVAKIDMRLVPDMTPDDTVAKLRRHLDAKGFADIEINVSGGYGPTLERSIALARLSPGTRLDLGESCAVEIRGKPVAARRVAPPFARQGAIRIDLD